MSPYGSIEEAMLAQDRIHGRGQSPEYDREQERLAKLEAEARVHAPDCDMDEDCTCRPCHFCGTPTTKYDPLAGPYCGCKNDRPNGFFCSDDMAEKCKAAGRCMREYRVCNE